MPWLLDKFGGKRQQLKGMLDAVRYDYDGFSSVWVLVTKGEAEPSQGRAIDHIGWRSVGPLADTINALRAKKVEVTSEPRPLTLPNGPPINFSYVAGPSGARIELGRKTGTEAGTITRKFGALVPNVPEVPAFPRATFCCGSNGATVQEPLAPGQNDAFGTSGTLGTLGHRAPQVLFALEPHGKRREVKQDEGQQPGLRQAVGAAQLHMLAGHRIDFDRV